MDDPAELGRREPRSAVRRRRSTGGWSSATRFSGNVFGPGSCGRGASIAENCAELGPRWNQPRLHPQLLRNTGGPLPKPGSKCRKAANRARRDPCLPPRPHPAPPRRRTAAPLDPAEAYFLEAIEGATRLHSRSSRLLVDVRPLGELAPKPTTHHPPTRPKSPTSTVLSVDSTLRGAR